MKVMVIRAGFLSTVQDLGRTGFREFGVSVGGALDSYALRVANLLVGNEESNAALEITLGGLQLRFDDERLVAWCGGDFDVRLGSTSFSAGRAAFVRAGEELTINQPKIGCRAWLAISGGIDVPIVLESRSTDLRAGFGGLDGRALQDGDVIRLGEISSRAKACLDDLRAERIARVFAPCDWASPAKPASILRIVRGSDWARFDDSSHAASTRERFSVLSESDRMGARLEGPELKRNEDVDLVSEAVAPGTIQVPPNGNPIVLLGDCQTIGGYPKIAHVITVDLPIAAQLRAGDGVRFQEVLLSQAHLLLAKREHDFALFRIGLETHMA